MVSNSIYYKDVLPDFDTFKEFVGAYTSANVNDSEHVLFCKYLLQKYATSSIAYDTKETFKRHFGITYENFFEKYKRQRELIALTYDITVDELREVQKISSANALNPATKITSPLENLSEYVDSQSQSLFTNNKLSSYKKAINETRDNLLNDFLSQFEKHFYKVFPTAIFIYEKEM